MPEDTMALQALVLSLHKVAAVHGHRKVELSYLSGLLPLCLQATYNRLQKVIKEY